MDDNKILEYWKSLTGLDRSEMRGIKKDLIGVVKRVYFEYYYREHSWFDISDYIREDALCTHIPFELSKSDLDGDVKKKLMVLMLEHSGNEYGYRKLPYHFMVSEIMDDGIRKWLRYMVRKDPVTPRDVIFKNSGKVMASKDVSGTEKMLYYFSLPNVFKNNAFFNEFTANLLKSSPSISGEMKTDIANLIMNPDELAEFLKEAGSALTLSSIKTGDLKFEDAPFLDNLPDFKPIVSDDLINDFRMSLWNVRISSFEHTRRHVCKWMLSLLSLKDKKKVIKDIMSENDKPMLLGAGDYLQFHGDEFDNDFLKKTIEGGIDSVESDIRALFYGLAFILLDDIEGYIDKSLNDKAIKVRHTLANVTLSPYKYKDMDDERKGKLIKYIIDRNVKLTKRQRGRLKKFKMKFMKK
ncbi:MAG: hypothetical protein A7316_06240 [Candidatus Altiarchaeales archaeon WOR_SM1_86-2]|nr:MAG: hypothetical protein A7316_06240 [Candidatus Altiarchaeales archaeon WOR_SM1_86-2]